MKLLLGVLVPALAVPAVRSTGEELRVEHRAGMVVAETRVESFSQAAVSSVVRVDGRVADAALREALTARYPSRSEERRSRWTTWYDRVEDGLPLEARRRFDELVKLSVDHDEVSVTEHPLVGRTIRLLRADGDAEVRAAIADDEGPVVDEARLKGHRLELRLGRFLPGEAVLVGDRWSLDAKLAEELSVDLGWGGTPRFSHDPQGGSGELWRAIRDRGAASGDVTFARMESVDGIACAVLVLNLELDLAETDVADPEEAVGCARASLAYRTTGRLWFAVAEGHPVRADLRMDGRTALHLEMTDEPSGHEVEIDLELRSVGMLADAWIVKHRR